MKWAGLFIDLVVKSFLTSISNNHNFVKGLTELVVFSQLWVIPNGRRTYYTSCSPVSQAKSNVTFNLRKGIEITSRPLSHTIYKLLEGSWWRLSSLSPVVGHNVQLKIWPCWKRSIQDLDHDFFQYKKNRHVSCILYVHINICICAFTKQKNLRDL